MVTLATTVAMAMEILATTLDVALAPVLLLFNIHHLEMVMETLAITQEQTVDPLLDVLLLCTPLTPTLGSTLVTTLDLVTTQELAHLDVELAPWGDAATPCIHQTLDTTVSLHSLAESALMSAETDAVMEVAMEVVTMVDVDQCADLIVALLLSVW